MSGNFLKNVIFKVDFLGDINGYELILENLKKVLFNDSPKFETQDPASIEVINGQIQRTIKEKRFKSFFFQNIATNLSELRCGC